MKHKILKKIIGLFGYKLIEKNASKNERLISNNSFLKIDKLLKVLFFEKKISNLIQIGANAVSYTHLTLPTTPYV